MKLYTEHTITSLLHFKVKVTFKGQMLIVFLLTPKSIQIPALMRAKDSFYSSRISCIRRCLGILPERFLFFSRMMQTYIRDGQII